MTNAKDIVDASGKPMSQRLESDLGPIAPHVPKTLQKSPMELLATKAGQERASMIGMLAGSYLTATNLDPLDVELVQAEKEDGSLGFRFRPREPQDHLWVIVAGSTPTQILAHGTSPEAASQIAWEERDRLRKETENPDLVVEAVRVPLRGFGEDIGGRP